MKVTKVEFICVSPSAHLDAVVLTFQERRVKKQAEEKRGNEILTKPNKTNADEQAEFSISVNQDSFAQCSNPANENVAPPSVASLKKRCVFLGRDRLCVREVQFSPAEILHGNKWNATVNVSWRFMRSISNFVSYFAQSCQNPTLRHYN